ncbi:short-chain dehydrogenase [Stemphylium lycopersici]|nr:short-chain dehydrogenase [Stemphylium lycopersici]
MPRHNAGKDSVIILFFTIPGEIGNQIYHLIVENRYVSLKSHSGDPSDPESASEQDQQEIAHASASEFRREYAYTVLSQIRRQLRLNAAVHSPVEAMKGPRIRAFFDQNGFEAAPRNKERFWSS